MRKVGALLLTVMTVYALLAQESLAQGVIKYKGSGGWGIGTQYQKMFDSKSTETLKGQVLTISKVTPIKGMSYGVQLLLKTEKEELSVHLGPGWYLVNQDMTIEPRDTVEVKGSRILFVKKPVIVATEVSKGDAILKLREENGFPLWNAWRRR
ncbi:MAG TPA: DNA-binding protein [Bacteroidota bacterium]|nr:DNA-binding protein [Bacteroidota bacterium]